MSAAQSNPVWAAMDDQPKGLAGSEAITGYMHFWMHRNLNDDIGIATGKLDQAEVLAQAPPPSGASKKRSSKKRPSEIVPLPAFALAPSGTECKPPDDLAQTTRKPPRDAVITGIIDEGIALGHARFRSLVDGKPLGSRVLTAWQQGAHYGGPDGSDPQHVPFGHVLTQSVIETLFTQHSHAGWLDEEAFNIASGLTDGSRPMGITTLERRVAHGSHVLDLAAGFDPVLTDPDALEHRPILAVTLPRREAIGMGGIFLQFFVVHAMQWIVDMADALWQAHYPDEEGGFPVAINLSFGQTAGPKNATSQIERAFALLAKKRGEAAPLRLIMPAGNDNLARGNAFTSFEIGYSYPDPVLDLPWRIQPDDHSPNFLELWVELDGAQPQMPHPLVLDVELPTGEIVTDIIGQHRQFTDLPGAGRIYAERQDRADLQGGDVPAKTLFQYLICVSPTMDPDGKNPVSPAGIWRIRGRWMPDGVDGLPDMDAKLYCSVQIDQAVDVDSLRNRRAYFDQSGYLLDDALTAPRDAYRYPYTGQPEDLLEGNGRRDLVQRRGSHNAVATHPEIIVVGGYRQSDGRPGDYSATYYDDDRTPYGAADRMTASLPTDSAVAHFGLRAAGPRSAATVALRGTSFAAGLATRKIVTELLEWNKAGRDPTQAAGSVESFAARAEQSERDGIYADAAHSLKIGHGRLPSDPLRQVDRLTWGGD